MELNDTISKAVRRCLALRMPFALVALPGSEQFTFFCGGVTNNGKTFSISPFNSVFPAKAEVIGQSISCEDILSYNFIPSKETNASPSVSSTDKDSYLRNITELSSRLSTDGGKTVIARIIVTESEAEPIDVAMNYFPEHISTFRYIFHSAVYGTWIGASPELLLDYDKTKGVFSTIALAGTRSCTQSGEWDCKNVEEHNFVLRHITSVLKQHGLEYNVSEPSLLKFGRVNHLMHTVTAKGEINPETLVGALSPTPAICGEPLNKALANIEEFENVPRFLYGGELCFRTPEHFICYANLRCAFARKNAESGKWTYNIYSGGGITADSVAENEWEETALKAESLLKSIER